MNDDSLKKQLRASFLSLVETGDPKVLHEVSRRSDDLVVLRAVARHANAAPLTLKLLAVANNKSLRKTIVKNKNCPYKTLLMLEDLGYEIPEEVMNHSAKVELSVRKGVEFAEDLPGAFIQEILKTM